MTECKKCNINIGQHDVILKIDEKIIFHVMITEIIDHEELLDKIENSILEFVKELVKGKKR